MSRFGFRRSRTARGDEGVALPVVIGIGLLMMTLVATSLTVATSGLRAADSDQDATGALNAAYAGVQEYVTRLNSDSTYPKYGNQAAGFNSGPALVLPTDANANPAFGVGSSGSGNGTAASGNTWAIVPGSGGTATFRYEVDDSVYSSSGTVRLRATGRVGRTTRTVLATVKRSGFVDFVYFTNYEIADPALTQIGGTGPQASLRCDVYGWAGRNNYACLNSSFNLPRFDSASVLNGAVHSNDTIAMSCSTFNGTVTTGDPGGNASYNGGKNYDNNASCGPHTSDGTAVPVTSVPLVAMPATNGSMQNETRSDLSTSTGCLYTGPTSVVFNANGTMTVTSPWTKFTNTSITGTSTTPNAGTSSAALNSKCGTPGTATGQLGSAGGATVPQLDQNLLYVQTVPNLTTDPNYTATTATPSGFTCLGADGKTPITGSGANAGWTFGGTSYPRSTEIPATYFSNTQTPSLWSIGPGPVAYGCRAGDLYVQGVVTTQTTVASDNYAYITDNLKDYDLTQDVLGLVANNAVIVWNPATSASQSYLTDTSGRDIQAAILSVAHSFTVQNFDKGSARGALNITGAVAQNFRGKIRNSGYSYSTVYKYDPLLASVTPPKFLAPANTTFSVSRYASLSPAFKWDGTR